MASFLIEIELREHKARGNIMPPRSSIAYEEIRYFSKPVIV